VADASPGRTPLSPAAPLQEFLKRGNLAFLRFRAILVDMSTSKTNRQGWLGELEHMILLSIVRLGDDAYAPAISATLEERARRRISRGALYSTLDRMERKGYVLWTIQPGTPTRDGNRSRRFEITAAGMKVLRTSHNAIRHLADGLGQRLTKGAPS